MTKGLRRPSVRVMLLWLLAGLLIGALAACTQAADAGIPSASDSQEASSGGANATQAETTPAAEEHEDALLAYSQCMRENGLPEFPDPDAEGRILMRLGSVDPDSAEFQGAADACRHLAPEGWGDTTLSPEDQEVMLEFARCMRENGVPDYPDPDPDAGNRIRLERNDPQAEAAFETCRPILEDLQGGPRIGG